VIPSGDRDALAKAMETLITHRTLALQLGAAARRAAERHSIEHMVEGMSQCLDEAILAASRLPGGHRA